MALYSFAVRKKGTDKYVQANGRHELPFLDFFAMRFNNKKELMKFLGADLEKYDDVVIAYKSRHKLQILPIYFDAKELDQVAGLMVDFSNFGYCENVYEILASAYKNPDKIAFKKIPDVKTFDEITRIGLKVGFDKECVTIVDKVEETIFSIEILLYELGDEISLKERKEIKEKCSKLRNLVGKVEAEAVEYQRTQLEELASNLKNRLYTELGNRFGITSERVKQVETKLEEENERRRFVAYEVELKRSYLIFRHGYGYLREKGLLSGELERKSVPDITMQDLYQEVYERKLNKGKRAKKSTIVQVYDVFKIELTPYEETLLERCVSENEEIADRAYEELMGLDTERLEIIRPVIDKYIRSVRGQQKSYGTV